VHIWVKRVPSSAVEASQSAVTEIRFSTTGVQESSLISQGFLLVPGNLNEGAGGTEVKMWMKRGNGPVAITSGMSVDGASSFPAIGDLRLSTATSVGGSFTAISQDLNLGVPGSTPVYLHVSNVLGNEARVALTWTPCSCDVGHTIVCAAALDNSTVSSLPICADIVVHADNAPAWSGVTPAADSKVTAYVGRMQRVNVSVIDSDPSRTIQLRIASVTPPHSGVTLSAVSRTGGSSTRHPFTGAHQGEQTTSSTWSAQVSWSPQWNEGGKSLRVCVEAVEVGKDAGCGSALTSSRCFTLEAARCRYAAGPGQQLVDIARVYGSDWHTLLALNAGIKKPDSGVYENQLLYVGHPYRIAAGDTLTKISGRFGTSLGSLHAMNSDLDANGDLLVGEELCVLPDSCTGMSNPFGVGGV